MPTPFSKRHTAPPVPPGQTDPARRPGRVHAEDGKRRECGCGEREEEEEGEAHVFHPHTLSQVATGDCPHTLFYGPPGAGKTTLVKATLREVFGPGADRVKVETTPWKVVTPSRTVELELTTASSNHHVELCPADAGVHDRYVVQEIIKDMARARPVDAVTGKRGGYKVVVLHEVDRLSRDAQAALRRTMEKYGSGCRLLLAASSLSRVIEPLRSRCLCVRVPAPSGDAIAALVTTVGRAEGLDVPPSLADRIAATASGNARRALLALQAARVEGYPFAADASPPPPDWERYVSELVAGILREQSPKSLYVARGKLYELLVNCLPADVLLRSIVAALLPRLDEQLKPAVAAAAAVYDARMAEGSKPVFHIEAFLARFMVDYRTWMLKMETG